MDENNKTEASHGLVEALEFHEGLNALDKQKDLASADWFLYLLTGEQMLATKIAKKFGYIYYKQD